MTTKEAAKKAGVSVVVFRERAKRLKLKAAGKVDTGKRGRPSFDWSAAQIGQVAKG